MSNMRDAAGWSRGLDHAGLACGRWPERYRMVSRPQGARIGGNIVTVIERLIQDVPVAEVARRVSGRSDGHVCASPT